MNWKKRKKLRKLSSGHKQFADKPYMYKRYVMMKCYGLLYTDDNMPSWAFSNKFVKFLKRKRWWESYKRNAHSSVRLLGKVSISEED